MDINDWNIGGPFSKVIFEKINLNSSKQVKEWLFTLNWKPTTWNYNKETKEKTSPKLTEDSFISLPPGIGQDYARYNVLKHRRNSILSFKDPENKGLLGLMRPDGRISATAITLGTNTGRYTHSGAYCNIPSNDATYGIEMRKCFRASEDRVFVGCDLSGIEMRMAAHFAYKYDKGKLMDMVLNGDFHKEQAENVYGCSRGLGKSVTYGILYGAGAAKAADILGCSAAKGQKLIDLFWDFNEGLGKLKKALERSIWGYRRLSRKRRQIVERIDYSNEVLNQLLKITIQMAS